MILEFKVENFLSFKDEQILNLKATSDKHLEDYHCIEVKPGVKILKTAIFFGSNASGKSNLLDAIDFLCSIATEHRNRGEKTGFVPFRYDKNSINSPGKFEIIFYIKEVKFRYTVIVDEKIIYKEELFYYPKTKIALIFNRQYIKEKDDFIIKIGTKIKSNKAFLEALKVNTLNNMTVISSISKINVKKSILLEIFNYFENLLVFNKDLLYSDEIYDEFYNKLKNNSEQKDSIINGLQKADFNIIDFEINKKSQQYKDEPKFEIIFKHKLQEADNVYEFYDYEESQGTELYFNLLSFFVLLKDENFIFGIDELDSSLHPELVNHFINTYLYQTKGKPTQFLFNTHNINLLDEDFIRKALYFRLFVFR